jgi:hypothetical protein
MGIDAIVRSRARVLISPTMKSFGTAGIQIPHGPCTAVWSGSCGTGSPTLQTESGLPGTGCDFALPQPNARFVPLHLGAQVSTERPASLPIFIQPDSRPGNKPMRDVVHNQRRDLESETEEFERIRRHHHEGCDSRTSSCLVLIYLIGSHRVAYALTLSDCRRG